jgi:hypothetical protein
MVGQGEGRPAAILARGDDNAPVGKLEIGVDGLDSRVVPLHNPPEEDVGVNLAAQLQIAAQTREVVGQHDHASGGRNQQGARCDASHLFVAQRPVASSEIDRVGKEALFRAQNPDIAIEYKDVGSGEGVKQFDPLRVQRGGECRA